MKYPLFSALVLLLLLTACGDDRQTRKRAARTGAPIIQCVNYPLAYFSERLAGQAARVRLEVPAGHDPAFWQPSDAEIRLFQNADLIVRNGGGYAEWMRTVSLPSARIVDTSEAFRSRLIDVTGNVTHAHGPGGDHTHGAVAFTTWLDFEQAALQAEAIAAALEKRGLVAPERLTDGSRSLAHDLRGLHARMQAIGERWGRQPLLASHPVYQYLARAYGLSIKSEHFEPHTLLSDEALVILRSLRKTYPATRMLWEAEPLPETIQALQQLGIQSVVFDPCANRPPAGDFLTVMQANVARLEAALGE